MPIKGSGGSGSRMIKGNLSSTVTEKERMDLMNVDYDDVLHLYRGWRKSENALKEKEQELLELRNRIKQLQESHQKFRSQIHGLEGVKELTIHLQEQTTLLQQENQELKRENDELASLNLQAEKLLQEKDSSEMTTTQILQTTQMDYATLRGRYEECLKAQHEAEKIVQHEQSLRLSLESRLHVSDKNADELREENRILRSKLEASQHKLDQCDHELLHASEQLAAISKEVFDMKSTQDALAASEAEVGVLRGDIARLLRLLEHSPSTREFVAHWKDCGGSNFVGLGDVHPTEMDDSFAYDDGYATYDHTTGESAVQRFDITPTEFAQLKRIHGSDPFPMTNNLTEEAEYWVPKDAARLGLQFMKARFPNTSPKVIMDFLRSMNKIWNRRERRKIKRVRQVLGVKIEDLRRQVANARPYKAVIQDRQIRRLKTQVRHGREKALTGRPVGALEEVLSCRDTFKAEDFGDLEYHHERRLCKMMARDTHNHDANVTRVSTEKLLEASLVNLNTMSRRLQRTGGSEGWMGSDIESDEEGNLTTTSHSIHGRSGRGRYPSSSYLRGALWLGRNMALLSEELSETLDAYRTKVLSDLTEISRDTDLRRSCHRLTLLTSSTINHVCTVCTHSKNAVRKILQGAASLNAGNATEMDRFLRTLPIESALTLRPASAPVLNGNTTRGGVEEDYLDHTELGHEQTSRRGSGSGRFSTLLDSSNLTRHSSHLD